MSEASAPADGVKFPSDKWRALFGAAGADGLLTTRGTGYDITRPASGNTVTLAAGSARVAGFLHQCIGSQDLTIATVVGATRTDTIVIRYDPSFIADPLDAAVSFPCRLVVVAGAPGAGAPTLDTTAPGVQDLPLFNITRAAGQALSATTLLDRRTWVGGVAGTAVVPDSGHGGVPTAPLQPKPGLRTLLTTSAGRTPVLFGTAFPNVCHSVQCWVESTTGTQATVLKGSVTRTGFTADVRGSTGSMFLAGVAVDVGYLAWGN